GPSWRGGGAIAIPVGTRARSPGGIVTGAKSAARRSKPEAPEDARSGRGMSEVPGSRITRTSTALTARRRRATRGAPWSGPPPRAPRGPARTRGARHGGRRRGSRGRCAAGRGWEPLQNLRRGVVPAVVDLLPREVGHPAGRRFLGEHDAPLQVLLRDDDLRVRGTLAAERPRLL